MINPETLYNQILAGLDAQDSGRYTWTNGGRDAINYAIDYTVTLMEKLLGEDKLSDESVRNISLYESVQTDSLSKFSLDDLSEDVWSIRAIFINVGTKTTPTLGTKSAKRLTSEEWAAKSRNCFLAGNDCMCVEELVDYAYMSPIIFGGSNITEVSIAPAIPNTPVGVLYLKVPTKMDKSDVTSESDIELPGSLESFMAQKALTFIGLKEAGEELTYNVSSQEVSQFISLLS